MRRITIAILAVTALLLAAWRPPAVQTAPTPAPRQTVSDPMVWMVRTPHGDQPVEHAQPTLWIEGQPHTRYIVDKPGVDKWLSVKVGER